MKAITRSGLPWLWLSAIIIVIDQLIKLWIVHNFQYQQPVAIFPFLNFNLAYNPGAAFSFLGDAGGWQVYFFASLSFIIAVGFIIWLARSPRSLLLRCLGISLIVGGALGNFIDRVRLTYVIDYVDFHVKGWHYATFNFADAAVCVGAFLLILSMLLKRERV